MTKPNAKLARILDRLEKTYGKQKNAEPGDAYGLVIDRICGYPPSDAKCAAGFAALVAEVGVSPREILAAPKATLRRAMRAGGIVPALRAQRLLEIAARVVEEYGGDLRGVMKRPLAEAKKALETFPTIADATAEKILLFTKTAPIAALPSNCIDVPVRLGFGRASKSWSAMYRSAQEAIEPELPRRIEARIRAYLLLKRHGQEICKRSRPLCERCSVSSECAYYLARGSAARS
jgi:endonuclease III